MRPESIDWCTLHACSCICELTLVEPTWPNMFISLSFSLMWQLFRQSPFQCNACKLHFIFIHVMFSAQKTRVYSMFSSWFRTHSSSASPESGLGTSHTSLPGSGPGSASEQQNEEMYYEPEPLQPLCICKALYPFDGRQFACAYVQCLVV